MPLPAVIKKHRFQLILILPLALYILGFTLAPIVQAVIMSMSDRFTGAFPTIANYAEVVGNFRFGRSFVNTIAITFISLTLELGLGLFLAVLLMKRFIGRGFLRMAMLLPLGVPTIVAAANMRYIFDTQGYLNELCYRLGLIQVPIDWTGGGILTILAIAVADMWKVTPLVMLILLAGLESIPGGLYEAARIDGASSWQMFRKITLPLLKPFITIALIVRGIDAFRLFELPITMVGSSTPVISTYTYFEYFQYNNPNTSAASAVILLVMIVISAAVYLRVAGREEAP